MRISFQERQAIVQAVHFVDPQAQIYLYGSRADDNTLGGDIDILLMSDKIKLMSKLDILVNLRRHLGDRKIDLTVYPDASKPFAKIALENGILLN